MHLKLRQSYSNSRLLLAHYTATTMTAVTQVLFLLKQKFDLRKKRLQMYNEHFERCFLWNTANSGQPRSYKYT